VQHRMFFSVILAGVAMALADEANLGHYCEGIAVQKEFEHSGEAIVQDVLCGQAPFETLVDIDPASSFLLIHLSLGSALAQLQVSAFGQDLPFIGPQTSFNDSQVALVKPKQIKQVCLSTNPCQVSVMIAPHHPMGLTTAFKLTISRGELLQFDQAVQGETRLVTSRRYGIEVAESDLDVLVALTPDQSKADADLDLFLYHESNLSTFFFPNNEISSRNHHWNTPEKAWISKGTLNSIGFMIIYAHASVDSSFEWNPFELVVLRNCEVFVLLSDQHVSDSQWLWYASLIGSAAGFLAAMLCFFLALFYILQWRQQRNPSRIPPKGASSLQIQSLPTFTLQESLPEDPQCTICLQDFSSGDLLKTMYCSHVFHKECIEAWLAMAGVCP